MEQNTKIESKINCLVNFGASILASLELAIILLLVMRPPYLLPLLQQVLPFPPVYVVIIIVLTVFILTLCLVLLLKWLKQTKRLRVEIFGYVCWLIGIILLILAFPAFPFCIQLCIYLISWGLAFFAIGTGFISLGASRRADRRMQMVDKVVKDSNSTLEQLAQEVRITAKVVKDMNNKMQELNTKVQMMDKTTKELDSKMQKLDTKIQTLIDKERGKKN
jgi:hypothetical protein